MTLSISIGADGATYMDCMEYARSAMDLALARGGDQAVVKTKGPDHLLRRKDPAGREEYPCESKSQGTGFP